MLIVNKSFSKNFLEYPLRI